MASIRLSLAGALVGLCVLVGAPAAPGGAVDEACAPGPERRYVCAVHRAFSRTDPTQGDLDTWVSRLPAERAAMTSVFALAPESRRATVTACYQYFAGDGPDPAGLECWQGLVYQPNGLRRLEAALLAAGGGTVDTYLDRAFGTLLGRAPETAERTYWGVRTEGSTRNRVAAELAGTLEARRGRVTWAFRNDLGDGPDRDYRAERTRTGLGFWHLRVQLIGSSAGSTSAVGLCGSPAPVIGPACT